MKKLIFVTALSILSFNINAQEVISIKKGQELGEIKKGAYYKFPIEIYQPFLGKYESQDGKFILNLQMEKLFRKGPDIYIDSLVGKLCSTEVFNDYFWEIKGSDVSNRNPNISTFLIFDSKGKGTGMLIFEIDEDGGSAKWKVKKKEGLSLQSEDLDPSLPKNLVLKRIK